MPSSEKNEKEKEEKFDLIQEIDSYTKKKLEQYIEYLLEYNKKINVISRKITGPALKQLISETILLNRYISGNTIIDAGSGNGILGVPISLLNPEKEINLVETKAKKIKFLEEIQEKLKLNNVGIYHCSIEEFIKNIDNTEISLVSRGFPGIDIFADFIRKKIIKEAILITFENKIKKIRKNMVNVRKKTYNIPLRNSLRIIKMENVSRET